jgi:Mrp family chromosome partitioning ATPase/capsular polysaccharide biosynthesis protein
VPLAAVALALRQSPLYQSSADVLLQNQTLPSALSGISDQSSGSFGATPTTSIDTQLVIAQLPLLSDRVAAALRKHGVSPSEVAGSTSAAEVGDTQVLRFTTASSSPALTTRIANEYAGQFALYDDHLSTTSINNAIRALSGRIAELQSRSGTQTRSQIVALQTKIGDLQTYLSLQTSAAKVVRPAVDTTKIRPRPTKYGLLGLGLGLVLGIGLAFLRDAFDTRLRTPEQIGGVLRLPLLARVPPPSRQLQRDHRLAMIAEPTSHGADAYRRLRMNLEFAAVGKPSQVIMFASALAKEGKSTTLANLAVAAALAGKNVAVVDLDLRRPALSRFFRLDDTEPGLTAVVLGHAALDDALLRVPLESLSRNTPDRFATPGTNGNSAGGTQRSGMPTTGSLVVLPSGILPPDPGDFVGLEGVGHLISALRERVDLVLLDVPPLLAVGDGLTISGLADSLVVVIRSENARRKITGELAGVLARMRAEGLGYVLCGAGADDSSGYYGYGYRGGYGSATERGRGAVV